MRKKIKKAFTLVELLVVIAILAILATVSIVGYNSFTKKAKVSNDTALVSQLNTLLKADSMVNGDARFLSDALKVTEDAGYDVEKLTPTATDYEIIWNQKINQFALLDENGNAVYGEKNEGTEEYKNWKFVSEYDANSTYSMYLTGTELNKDITDLKVGIDVGSNTNIQKIHYINNGEEKDDVRIYTNGDTLTIDAPLDSISHNGIATRIDVNSVANHSFHEYGFAKAIVAKQGNIIISESADVKVVIANPNAGANMSITIPEQSNTIFYAPDTVITPNKKPVGEAKSENVENIVNGVKLFDGGDGTEGNPYLISNCEQALNIENSKGHFKLTNDIIVTNEIYMSRNTFTIDLNGHKIELHYADGIKPNNGGVFNISGKKGVLTVKDSSELKNGVVKGDTRTYSNKVTSAIRVGNYGKLNIYGGEFIGQSEGTSCIFVYTNMSSSNKATVNIYGGTFKTEQPSNGIYYVLNHQDSFTTGCVINVYGGTFINYNPGVTKVDPDNARTGKILLGSGCKTTEKTVGKNIHYIVSK